MIDDCFEGEKKNEIKKNRKEKQQTCCWKRQRMTFLVLVEGEANSVLLMDTPPSLKTKGSVGQLALEGGNVRYLGVSSADYSGCRGLDQVWRIVLPKHWP